MRADTEWVVIGQDLNDGPSEVGDEAVGTDGREIESVLYIGSNSSRTSESSVEKAVPSRRLRRSGCLYLRVTVAEHHSLSVRAAHVITTECSTDMR